MKRVKKAGEIISLPRIRGKYRFSILFFIFIAVVGGIFGFKKFTARADVAILYPTSCLGGWISPTHAEGKPDLNNSDDVSAYSLENSAVLDSNTNAEIFCGKFTGDIGPDSFPRKMVLTFSWNATRFPNTLPSISSTVSSSTISGTNFASSSGAILDAGGQGSSTSFTLIDTSISSTSVPSSDLTITSSNDASSSQTTLNSTAIPTTSSTTTFDIKAIASTTPIVQRNDFLEVDYTFDGINWKTLGTLDEAHLHYASFEIPLDPISTWADTENIQIKIKSLPSIDTTPTVYLDGMTLTVDYAPIVHDDFVTSSGLYMQAANTDNANLALQIRDNDKVQELVLKTTQESIGGIAVYDATSGVIKLTTHIDGDSYVFQPEYFGKGTYDIIQTADPDTCSNRSLLECKSSSNYKGEGEFIVGDNNGSPNLGIPNALQATSISASSSVSSPVISSLPVSSANIISGTTSQASVFSSVISLITLNNSTSTNLSSQVLSTSTVSGNTISSTTNSVIDSTSNSQVTFDSIATSSDNLTATSSNNSVENSSITSAIIPAAVIMVSSTTDAIIVNSTTSTASTTP